MATQVTVNAGQGSTQVTVITGEGSTSYKVEAGSRGPAGPNSVTTSTSSNLTGFIAADGTNVSGATAGATAATANTLALRDATGGSNFAAVGATSVTSSGAISTTGSFGSISTIGGSAGISTEGNGATITTSGSSAHIQTTGGEAFIATSGVYAQITTTGDYASITTTGDYASITTSGANAFIQSRSTFKLYNGASTTTLSHSPTADRAIAFPDKAGTVAMIDAETHTGAHAFSSTTRPTSAGTGTPAATSLITRADGDARYGQFIALYKNADTVRTAYNVYTLDPDLQTPVENNAVYHFQFYARGVTGLNAGISTAAQVMIGPNCSWSQMFYERAGFESDYKPSILSPLTTTQVFAMSSSTNAISRITGTFKTSASGTFGFQWGNSNAGGGNSTIEAGSYLILTRIA